MTQEKSKPLRNTIERYGHALYPMVRMSYSISKNHVLESTPGPSGFLTTTLVFNMCIAISNKFNKKIMHMDSCLLETFPIRNIFPIQFWPNA